MMQRLFESELPTRRWTRKEYDRLIELDIVHEDEKLELLDGLLVLRDRLTPVEASAIRPLTDALRHAFGAGWSIDSRFPIALDDDSEPEPDVAVVRGAPDDFVTEHPSRPALVVEVALTTLELDRDIKGGLYARAGVPDYWIVNLVDGALEVRRGPVTSDEAPYGWIYERLTVLGREDSVTPLAAPFAVVPVGDLLPSSTRPV